MTEPRLARELWEHLERFSRRLGKLNTPVHAYVAGGMAVNYHTGYRMSHDVDIKWSHKVLIPPDLQVFEVAKSDAPNDRFVVAMDGNFSDVLGSFPPDWEENSTRIGRVGDIVVHIMDPTDLAVSKVARFQDQDRDDIRELAKRGLVDPDVFQARAEEALQCFIGDTTFAAYNVEDATRIVREAIDDHEAAGAPEP